jgi:hypothetical protein
VHQTDPRARVIFGGLSNPDLVFARAALAECAAKVDVVAYHTYPGFGSNHMPEEEDDLNRPDGFRNQIRKIPGIRKDLVFWVNEWNVSPHWKNSNESVQARYLPRFYLYTHAQGVRGSVWTFIPGTDGNEGDIFGVLHGETFKPDAFQPREAYRSFSVTSALFSQTVPDREAEWDVRVTSEKMRTLRRYAFRDKASGKRIYAFWLALPCDPNDNFRPVPAELTISDADLKEPILIDVRTGTVTPVARKTQGVIPVTLKDSVMAVADASFLDWPVVPEAPGQLQASGAGPETRLQWKRYSQATRMEIQRSIDYGPWRPVAETTPDKIEFSEHGDEKGHITYRVRAKGEHGPSPWSNPAWVDIEK